jgi:Helicase conserved C-terminal domain
MLEGFELEDEACRGLESEQERLDRQGIYGEIKRELIKRGIPAEEIAFIHDFDSPAQKAQAFAAANAGKIRVMLASTEKLAYGANLQERLYAVHHGDGPWRPSDVEQREGRLLRHGNKFPEVCIFNYVTEGSFDGFIWQTLENKARFISQIMSGEVSGRSTEDVDDMVMTAAQVKAIASGNPRILERVSIEVELTRLSRLYTVWRNGRRNLKWELESLPDRIREADQRVTGHEQAKAARDQNSADGAFTIKLKRALGGDEWISFDQRAQSGEHLDKLRRGVGMAYGTEYFHIGSYRGFQILAQRRMSLSDAPFPPVEGFLCLPGGKLLYPFKFGDSDQGVMQSIDAQLRAIDSHLDRALKNRDELKHRQEVIERELASGWSYARKYEELQAHLRRVNQLLKEDGSQIDDKQEFAALDEDAFRHCEPDVEKSVQPTGAVSAPLEVTTASAEPVGNQTAPSHTAEKKLSFAATVAIVGEPSRRQITLDDLRSQAPQTNRRKPSASPRAGQPAQLSLWQ